MKNYILILVLLTSCMATRVEESTLVPALHNAWVGVRSDIMQSKNPPLADIKLMDEAIELGDRAILRQVDLGTLEDHAIYGIQVRVIRGEIGEGVAASLRERFRLFSESCYKLTGFPPYKEYTPIGFNDTHLKQAVMDMRDTWPTVRTDVMAWLQYACFSPTLGQVELMDKALDSGKPEDFEAINWYALKQAAVLGVDMNSRDGSISESTARLRLDALEEFDTAMGHMSSTGPNYSTEAA